MALNNSAVGMKLVLLVLLLLEVRRLVCWGYWCCWDCPVLMVLLVLVVNYKRNKGLVGERLKLAAWDGTMCCC